jgi:hypothetical protein
MNRTAQAVFNFFRETENDEENVENSQAGEKQVEVRVHSFSR